MTLYAALIDYVDGIVEKRTPHRPAHLAWLESLQADGHLLMAGAYADPTQGALFVYRADDEAQVRDWIDRDPYNQAGLFAAVTLREWNVVVGRPA